MTISNALRFYSAPTFPGLGASLVITATETSQELNRCAEFHLFLFDPPRPHTFRCRRYTYQGMTKDLIPDSALHEDALRIAQAELDSIVYQARKEKTSGVIPDGFCMDLTPCTPEWALIQIVRHKPSELNKIKNETCSPDLDQFLDITTQRGLIIVEA